MNYEEAALYIKEAGRRGSVFGLDGISCLMKELGNVQEKLSIIHIAGTNGKGSAGAFLASVLTEAGYRVGRYTSPAVFSPLEVWQINGIWMAKTDYARICSRVKAACDRLAFRQKITPTVFEIETAMAFLYFYEKSCDYVLLEAGMGGRLDATNLIQRPLCSVITSISMDHMQILGNTIAKIAEEKAGIIKKHCPVVTILQEQKVMEVLERKAKEQKAALIVADCGQAEILNDGMEEIRYRYPLQKNIKSSEICLSMTGGFQIENSVLALTVLDDILHIEQKYIKSGLKKAVWPGRFEILMRDPLFIIDGAHNIGAAEKLRLTIQNYFTNRKITYIIGVLADKEYEKIIELLLPMAYSVFTVTPPNIRALSSEQLKAAVESACIAGWSETVSAGKTQYMKEQAKENRQIEVISSGTAVCAAEEALLSADKSDVILAFGSLTYLSEIRQYVKWRMACHDDRQGEDKAGC